MSIGVCQRQPTLLTLGLSKGCWLGVIGAYCWQRANSTIQAKIVNADATNLSIMLVPPLQEAGAGTGTLAWERTAVNHNRKEPTDSANTKTEEGQDTMNAPTYQEFLRTLKERRAPVGYWESLMADDQKEARLLYVQHLAELGQTATSQSRSSMRASERGVPAFQTDSTPPVFCSPDGVSRVHLAIDIELRLFPTQRNGSRQDTDCLL